MDAMFGLVGLVFDSKESEVVFDAIMSFVPPEDYKPEDRAILERLKRELRKGPHFD